MVSIEPAGDPLDDIVDACGALETALRRHGVVVDDRREITVLLDPETGTRFGSALAASPSALSRNFPEQIGSVQEFAEGGRRARIRGIWFDWSNKFGAALQRFREKRNKAIRDERDDLIGALYAARVRIRELEKTVKSLHSINAESDTQKNRDPEGPRLKV